MAIVVSILARTLAGLRANALAQVPFADVIELRCDFLRADPAHEADVAAFAPLIREIGKPVIVAVNDARAFGQFRGTRDERFALLRAAARAGAAFVDIDWTEAELLGDVAAPCRRIVSRHETQSTPRDLATVLAELRAAAHPQDRLKLVTHAMNGEDGVRTLELARTNGLDLIAFSSGEIGRFTRVLAPIFGSPFTYAAPAQITGPADGPNSTSHSLARMPAEGAAEFTTTAPGQLRVDELRALWPHAGVSTDTRVFAVLGNPARHSLSPRLHGVALRAQDIDAVYVAIDLANDGFDAFIARASAPCWRGFSVTAPFKGDAFRIVRDDCDAASRAAQACNTLVRTSAGWRGANTDAPAVLAALETLHGSLAGSHVVLVGAGGAAVSALVALREVGARVTLAGRDVAKARAVALLHGCESCAIEALPATNFDVLVNCTPAGSLALPDEIPMPAEALRRGVSVLDAVYRPRETPLLREAARRGCRVLGGSEWFVRQALAQFRLFTGRDADERAMRDELERALSSEVGA